MTPQGPEPIAISPEPIVEQDPATDPATVVSQEPATDTTSPPTSDALPWLAGIVALSWAAHRAARKLSDRIPSSPPPKVAVIEPGMFTLMVFLLGAAAAPYVALLLLGSDSKPNETLFASMLVTAVANLAAAAAGVLYARNRSGISIRELGLSPRTGGASYAFAVVTLLSFLPIYLVASILNGALLEALDSTPHQEVVQSLLTDQSLRSSPATLFLICVCVPIGEEMIFRGYLQRAVRAIVGPFGSILLASVAFALVHDPAAMIPIFVIGVCLGLICERTGSIWPAALAHAVFNSAQMLNVFFLAQ